MKTHFLLTAAATALLSTAVYAKGGTAETARIAEEANATSTGDATIATVTRIESGAPVTRRVDGVPVKTVRVPLTEARAEQVVPATTGETVVVAPGASAVVHTTTY